MSSKDKKLLIGLFVFIVLALVIALGIVPNLNKIKDLKETNKKSLQQINTQDTSIAALSKKAKNDKKLYDEAKDKNDKAHMEYKQKNPNYEFTTASNINDIVSRVNDIVRKYTFSLDTKDFKVNRPQGSNIATIDFKFPYTDGSTLQGYFLGYVPVEVPQDADAKKVYDRLFKTNKLGETYFNSKIYDNGGKIYFKSNKNDAFKESDVAAMNIIGGPRYIINELTNELANLEPTKAQIKVVSFSIPKEILKQENNVSSSTAPSTNTQPSANASSPVPGSNSGDSHFYITDNYEDRSSVEVRPVFLGKSFTLSIKVVLLSEGDKN